MIGFREIAPGVFTRDIEGARETRSKARAGARRNMQNAAENDDFRAAGTTRESSHIDDLIGSALHVATTIGDARAQIDHTLRAARSLFGEQLREAQRAVDRASRRVR